MDLTIRVATRDDLPALREVMDASIGELQRDFLSEEQIESSRAIMGLDTQLVDDGARIRAMYTNPAFARRGVGRLILETCERAAAAEGFTRLQLAGTLSGEPLYKAYGFVEVGRSSDDTGGAPVPIVLMERPIRL